MVGPLSAASYNPHSALGSSTSTLTVFGNKLLGKYLPTFVLFFKFNLFSLNVGDPSNAISSKTAVILSQSRGRPKLEDIVIAISPLLLVGRRCFHGFNPLISSFITSKTHRHFVRLTLEKPLCEISRLLPCPLALNS